jgi:hypothetical protein
MNCAYDAFAQHIRHLGKLEYGALFEKYLELKRATHGPDPVYTFAGLIPWIYTGMLYEYNMLQYKRPKLSLNIQWHYVTWEECYREAEIKHKSIMRYFTPYPGANVDKITLKPAIYGLLNEQHAVFSEEIPSWPGARIILAVQIREVELKEIENE